MNTGPIPLEADTKRRIIQTLTEKIRDLYIFPDTGEQICNRLQGHAQAGEYADITEGELFALALTMHMHEVSHDEHLWVRWHAEPLPDENPLRENQERQEQLRLEAKADNYGFQKVEILPGNIGYLEIRYLHRPEWGGETVTAAMNFVANTQALIFDLRKCTGGYPGMIALICSYLFGEEPLLLESIYWKDDNRTQEFRTLRELPGKRFGEKPVHILTSKETFSGGEDLAYILQTRKRATVFGEKTDGGAHPGASYSLHPHFEVFIPIGRVTNAVTHTDWEGTGVTPDVLLPKEEAFRAAYQIALEAVLANPDKESTREARKTLDELLSRR
jgi:C-terminal processing protease CtpA/Prc